METSLKEKKIIIYHLSIGEANSPLGAPTADDLFVFANANNINPFMWSYCADDPIKANFPSPRDRGC